MKNSLEKRQDKNKENIDDASWVKRVKKKDTMAFEYLIKKYQKHSYSLAFSITNNENEAMDVVQDSFCKAFLNIHKFREESNFSTWLYRIVFNTATQALKKLSKRNKAMDLTPKFHEIPTEQQHLNTGTKWLYLAIQQLNSKEQLMLQLFYLEEKSIEEIKIITQFKTSKIKVTLHRARKNLDILLRKSMGIEIKDLL